MKRLSCFTVLIVFCFSIFAFSVNPSMDGRAVVADNGVFPPGGYYGKAPGYLPGDTVVVTNHSNGFSIDVLILGSYDAYEGIAILLSPEAAEKLQITKGRDVYVKVQKKQPIPYEEAVATSRNKKAPQNNVVDTDKDSSVLPGETEKLVNDVVGSTKKYEDLPVEEELPYENLENLESSNDVVEETNDSIAKDDENPVDEKLDEETQLAEETTDEVKSEETLPEEAELAEIENEEPVSEEDYIVIEPSENEQILAETSTEENEVEQEIPSELVAEVNPEDTATEEEILPEENSTSEDLAIQEDVQASTEAEEVILADPEEYVESEEIISPVIEPTQEVAEEIPELPVENEEVAVLDDTQDEDYDASDVIETPVESEIAEEIPQEISEEIIPQEEVASEDNYLNDEEFVELMENVRGNEIAEELPAEETDQVVLEDLPEETELEEEILIPEDSEEIALEKIEDSTEDEIIEPEVLATETVEDEPELAILDDQIFAEPEENSVTSPKDIFSMIVGENPDEDIIEDVLLEETDPKVPELEDFSQSDESVADVEIELSEPELNIIEPVTNLSEVFITEKEEAKLSVVEQEEYSEADKFSNTVSEFSALPKVKQAKSKTYYIQIATVSSKENVAKIVEVHGEKYPVYVLQNSSKNMYQVLIGPLNDDEYALVLARFKQNYKDAFIRVLK